MDVAKQKYEKPVLKSGLKIKQKTIRQKVNQAIYLERSPLGALLQ